MSVFKLALQFGWYVVMHGGVMHVTDTEEAGLDWVQEQVLEELCKAHANDPSRSESPIGTET